MPSKPTRSGSYRKGPRRDWAERAAGQRLRRLEKGLAAVHWNQGGDVAFITELARALRRAEKRGYQRGKSDGYAEGHEDQMKMRVADALERITRIDLKHSPCDAGAG